MKLAILKVPDCGRKQNEVLDTLAAAGEKLGHEVSRFYRNGSVGNPDIVVLWNSQYDWVKAFRREYPGVRILFTELGWLPQTPCFQVDNLGVNAFASWAMDPVVVRSFNPLPVRESKELLVILQDDTDTQIRSKFLNPSFPSMADWLRFLLNTLPEARLRVRGHPDHPASDEVKVMMSRSGNFFWDDSANLDEAMGKSVAMLTINSSCAIAALGDHMPVITFGRSVYSSAYGACYVIHGTEAEMAEDLSVVVNEVLAGRCSLNAVAQEAAFGRVLAKQWWPKDVEGRLAWWLR